jgi:hypothetical protein
MSLGSQRISYLRKNLLLNRSIESEIYFTATTLGRATG